MDISNICVDYFLLRYEKIKILPLDHKNVLLKFVEIRKTAIFAPHLRTMPMSESVSRMQK